VCGIAGIYNSNKSKESLKIIGHQMMKQIHHRGPDGNGLIVRNGVGGTSTLLTHVRLSVIDLSEQGKQPMRFNDGKTWIVFNGEIYNYSELKLELEKEGVKFKTRTDTEVILAAYNVWGMKCFERFIGMWAIAIWDESKDKLILSRDRMGIKPLYFAYKDSTWYFGSEPKVILAQLPELRKLNKQALSDYFSYRQVLGKDTFYKGISKVEAGTHIVISRNKHRIVRYWDLERVIEKEDPGIKEVSLQVSSLLDSSVAYRMISDVPVGSFLSGGLDSSILVSKMSRLRKDQIKTFNIGFGEEGFNEFNFAQEVSDYCNTDHTQVQINANQYLDSLDKMIQIKDAPLAVPNEIALHVLSKILKKDATVVLSGEGADELFGGYGRIFRSAYDYERVSDYGRLDVPKTLHNNLLKKYHSINWDDDLDHFLNQYSYMSLSLKQDLFTPDLLEAINGDLYNRNYFENIWSGLNGMSLTDKYMWIFQRIHLEGLLGRLDSSTMSASVEGRVPFVDHRLIEYVNRLPLHYKMHWRSSKDKQKSKFLNSNQISEKHDITKYILREACRSQVPKSITNRQKVGFPVPLASWLSGELKDYVKDHLLSENAKTRDLFHPKVVKNLLNAKNLESGSGLNIWMMLNTELWLQSENISI